MPLTKDINKNLFPTTPLPTPTLAKFHSIYMVIYHTSLHGFLFHFHYFHGLRWKVMILQIPFYYGQIICLNDTFPSKT